MSFQVVSHVSNTYLTLPSFVSWILSYPMVCDESDSSVVDPPSACGEPIPLNSAPRAYCDLRAFLGWRGVARVCVMSVRFGEFGESTLAEQKEVRNAKAAYCHIQSFSTSRDVARVCVLCQQSCLISGRRGWLKNRMREVPYRHLRRMKSTMTYLSLKLKWSRHHQL